MKYYEVKRYKIIYDNKVTVFEKKLNDAIEDLRDKRPEINISESRPKGFLAYITYLECQKVPETLSDELELRGLQIKCNDCPYIQRTTDARRKRFKCPYAPYGQTYLESPACNKFYEDLIQTFYEWKSKEIEKSYNLSSSILEITD